jgi:hypothetical protein
LLDRQFPLRVELIDWRDVSDFQERAVSSIPASKLGLYSIKIIYMSRAEQSGKRPSKECLSENSFKSWSARLGLLTEASARRFLQSDDVLVTPMSGSEPIASIR